MSFPPSPEPSTLNLEPSTLLLPIVRSLQVFLDETSDFRELVKRYQVFIEASGRTAGLEQIQLMALLGCSHGQARLGKFDASRSLANRARVLAKDLGDLSREAKSLMLIGSAELDLGNNGMARERCSANRWLSSASYVKALESRIPSTHRELWNSFRVITMSHGGYTAKLWKFGARWETACQ